MLTGMAGLGMVQQTLLDSLFGSMGTDAMAGLGGLGASLKSADSEDDLNQLAALLGGSQQQSAAFKPAQLLQVRQAPATGNAGRGTASGNTETNRGRGHYTSGGACKN